MQDNGGRMPVRYCLWDFFINGKRIIPLIEYFFSFLIADCTCHGGTTLPPSTNECSILVASLTVLEEFNGSSFIVSPGSFVTLSYLVSASEPVTNFYKAFLITYPKHSIDLFIWVHQSEYLRYRILLGWTCELKLKISMGKDELKKTSVIIGDGSWTCEPAVLCRSHRKRSDM